MKKFLSILISLSLVLYLVGCGAPASGESTPDSSSESTVTESESTSESSSESVTESTSESTSESKTETALQYPWGIEIAPMVIGQPYPYKTICTNNSEQETWGTVTLDYYTVTKTDDPDRVERSIALDFTFDDIYAQEFGMRYGVIYIEKDTELYSEGDGDILSAEKDGKEFSIEIKKDDFVLGQWIDHKYYGRYELCLEMPADYEDYALIVVDYGKSQNFESEMGQYIEGFPLKEITNPDTPWFVMDNSVPVGEGSSDYMPADGATEVKINNWDLTELNKNIAQQVNFKITTYNMQQGQFLRLELYDGDSTEPVTYNDMMLSPHEKITSDFGMVVDSSALQSDEARFVAVVTDNDGNRISEQTVSIPLVDGPSDPAADPDYTDSDESYIPDGEVLYTYVEVVDWDTDTLDRNGITDVVFDLVATETYYGDYIIAIACAGDETDVIDTHRIDLGDKHNSVTELETGFSIDGSLVDAESVAFKFYLYNSDGEEMSMAQLDIPFGEADSNQPVKSDSESESNVVINVTNLEREEKDEFDLDVAITGWEKGDQLYVFVYEPAGERQVDINYELECDENHFGMTITEDELDGNTLIFEIVVADSTGKEICCETRELVIE